ncbi:hypothetical protein HPB51_026020 [Rhipicephalus microplus]|uniref:Uncharacterized protein n=1 Tax=Rhipicephalus microplus TaxID=6941 RepID=A0A9J6EE35_RHIMP|nr:hypothetical protein HPB51_026020 [Rhipicephalus microplus]
MRHRPFHGRSPVVGCARTLEEQPTNQRPSDASGKSAAALRLRPINLLKGRDNITGRRRGDIENRHLPSLLVALLRVSLLVEAALPFMVAAGFCWWSARRGGKLAPVQERTQNCDDEAARRNGCQRTSGAESTRPGLDALWHTHACRIKSRDQYTKVKGSFAMKSCAILALLILGHLCEIQAATLSKPAMSTDDAKKLLIEKLSRSIMEHREELLDALQATKSTGDGTDEQILPALLVPLITAIAGGAISGAVGAEIQAATLSKPAMSTDDAKKLLIEKLSRSIMEHREELLEALQGINSTGDRTDEQIPGVLLALLVAIAGGVVSGAVEAGVAVAVSKG